jgi:ATP-dependent DNA helicase DinG
MTASVEGVLGEGGLLAERLGASFESRDEQVDVARAVLRAMEEKSILLCEAGTGVGKSFAYLVPAMLRCLAGETVVIATNTIALQEQLVRKDVPLLREILDPDGAGFDSGEEFENAKIRPVLVKGRGNYVSLRRLKLASQRQDKLFADPAARRSLHVIEDWAATTLDGTLSTLPAIERPGVWDKVESDTGNCMGRKCPSYQACFYQRVRRTMEKGNLLICNHALFFSDLALRAQEAGFLPEYQHVVLDEAHNAEDVASEHFGVSLTEGRVMHLLTTLYAERSGKGYLANLTSLSSDSGSVEGAIREVLFAAEASRRFFESALELLPRRGSVFGGGGGGGGEPGSVRFREPGLLDAELAQRMTRLSLSLKALRDGVKDEADQFELNAYAQRAQMIADAAVTLAEQKLPGCAYWVEAGGESDTGRLRKVTVACAPVEVGPLLKQHLFGREFGVTLTSATLATRTRRDEEMEEHAETAFAHVMARLGCEGLGERRVRTMQVGSPFDYAKQAEVVVDERVDSKSAFTKRVTPRDEDWVDVDGLGSLADMPAKREPSYAEKLAACLEEHLRETEGGAFVLFTSFATLNAVARILRPRLEPDGMPVLGQGLDGSREEILARFREDERSVLLGAASFWQGVDVRGRGLRNVVITKLPFEPPDRPLTEARGELIQQRGGNPFMEDAIPRAVIRFKQGFGRLIRSKEDRGRVVVMDGRVFSARYGRLFLEALPKGVPVRRVRG